MKKTIKIRKTYGHDYNKLIRAGYDEDFIIQLPTIYELKPRYPRTDCAICGGCGQAYIGEGDHMTCWDCGGSGYDHVEHEIMIGATYEDLEKVIEENQMLNKLADTRSPRYIIEGEEV